MKKKIWGIAIGVVVLIAVIIGAVMFQKQTDEKQKLTNAKDRVTLLEKETSGKGKAAQKIDSLYDEKQDFLAKKISLQNIKEADDLLLKQQRIIENLEKTFGSELNSEKAEKNIEKLQEKVVLANDKLEIQTAVNELFNSKEAVIRGSVINKDLPIIKDLKKEDISAVTEAIEKNKALKCEWKEAVESILKNASAQVDQIEKVKKLIKEAFDGDVPKKTVKQSDYDTLKKEIDKVKNKELKDNFTAKLLLIKADIDAKAQADEQTKQQEEAEKEAAQAVADAAAQASAGKTTTESSEKKVQEDNPLAGYSANQIETARVWLTVMGSKPSALYSSSVGGTPIDPYDAGSVNYPAGAVMLSGGGTFEGMVVYSSNGNGTITVYPAPSHWQIGAENAGNPEKVRELTQAVLDGAYVVNVAEGDPKDIKELILLQR